MRIRAMRLAALVPLVLLTACSHGVISTRSSTPTATAAPIHTPSLTDHGDCPAQLVSFLNCYTPYLFRRAYGIQPLTDQGLTGKGQTVVLIESFGSPTAQRDINIFDQRFGLPPVSLQIIAPLGTVPFDPNNRDMVGWAGETELDTQVVHALAPGANIVILTSPVSETEGTIGLPEFLKLEQYAVQRHLGNIVSQSWGASEATLADSAGQQVIHQFASFYQQATTQGGITFIASSGDSGAIDYTDIAATQYATTRTVGFPADVPWVTVAGGTMLYKNGNTFDEVAWPESGGGVSKFFSEPDFQKNLPASDQSLLAGYRGIPDVAADAAGVGSGDTGLAVYLNGEWTMSSGTSTASPIWAANVAIADEMAGHPLGFINPGLYKLAQSPSYAQDFRDVTQGDNSCCPPNPVQGFSAGSGWDAVTGLGAPQAARLLPDLIAALGG